VESKDPGESSDPVLEAIRAGVETRATEFKQSCPFDEIQWKIVKTCMALANLRDGGRIIIGVAERDGRWQADGVDSKHLEGYTHDKILELVNRHARPPISLLVRLVPLDSKTFVAIEVGEFDRVPIFCGVATPKTAGKDALRVGDMPARSRDRVATSRIYDADLVAEIIEVAAEKRAASIIATAQRIGLRMPDDTATMFRRERGDFGGFE
jgi:predicted HTH transcriptional regulator